VAPHSEGWEFPRQIEKYRGIVEEAVFDRLGRPTLFDELVEVVMGRMKARVEQKNLQATAKSESTSGAFVPQGSGIRGVAEREAKI